MEAPQLRPLGVGDVVDRVFTLYRQRAPLFLALAAVPYLVLFLVLGGLTLAFAGTLVALAPLLEALGAVPPRAPEFTPSMGAALGTLFVLLCAAAVLSLIVLSAQSASLVDAAAARYLGRETTVGASFRSGLRAAPRVIGAGLLVFLAMAALWAVLLVAFVAANNALLVLVGVIAGLVATVFMFASWLVAPVVATLERAGPIEALRRSWALSSGHRWRILGLQLLLGVIQLVLSALVSFAFVATLIGDQAVRLVAQQLVNVVATIVWAPIEWGAFTVFYFDLRVRKEALDLQLAAEALPRDA